MAGTARAEPLEARNDWINDVMFGELTSDLAAEAHAAALVSAGRESAPQISAGGEVVWDLGICRAIAGGGEATYGREASGTAWASFCMPFPINRIQMTVRGDYAIEPSFASLPVALRARYTGIAVEVRNTLVAWSSPENGHEVLDFSFGLGTFEQATMEMGHAAFSIHTYRRTNRETGRQLDVLPFVLRASGPAMPAGNQQGIYLSSVAYHVAPLRVARRPLGKVAGHTLEVDGIVGLGAGSVGDAGTVLRREYDLHADLTLRVTRGADTLSLQARRAFEPTLTDELLLDTRLEAGWIHARERTTLGAFAVAAVTRRSDRGGVIDSKPSGSVRALYVRRLPHDVQLGLAGEVARTFYATLDDTHAADAEWAAQASATLSISIR